MARVTGCYAVALGPWRPPAPAPRTLPEGAVPAHLRLTAERAGERVQGRTAYRAEAGGFLRWWRTPGGADSLTVGDPWAESGAELVLAPAGADLAGRARVFTDVTPPAGPAEASRAVRARRVPCPPG